MPDGESEKPNLVPFDHDNPVHYAALLEAGRVGLANKGGTERVIVDLRDKHGLVAGVGTAFEALILAADERDRNKNA